MTEPEPSPYQGPPRYEGPPLTLGSATCYRHPDRPTGIVCTRCGRPICPECMVPASVGFQCPECVREGLAGVRRVKRGSGLRATADRWGAVTLSLIAVNVAMFVITAADAGLHGANPLDNYRSPLFAELAQVPLLVDAGQWWRIFTAGFLHFGLLHIGLNMLALLVFGAELERALGRWRFLGVYVVSLIGGAAALQLFGAPNVLAAGASTAIYGLFGALGVVLIVRKQDLRGLITLLVINIVISMLPGVSLIGHLGGLAAGVLATTLLVITRRRQLLGALCLVALAIVLVALALTPTA